MRLLVVGFLLVVLSACTSITSLMFYPRQNFPVTPDQLGVPYETIHHQAMDGTNLVSWWLPAKNTVNGKSKGSILVLHGNAQNMSYHQLSVNWLPAAGYDVFMLGYREYGQSEGLAKLPDIFMDVHSGLDWILKRKKDAHLKAPLYVLGQSIGASLAVYGLASYPQKNEVSAVVLDAGFDSYPDIASEAMSKHWLTWLLQPVALSITSQYDPIEWVSQWGEMPLLMMHSPQDKVVAYRRGKALFGQANEPKQWQDSTGRHVESFAYEPLRLEVIQFLEKHRKTDASGYTKIE